MSNGLLAFAAGFGNGYFDQQDKKKADEERRVDRDNRQQEFDARMDEVKQAKSLRLGLADAARPATVNNDAAMLDVSGKPAVYEDAGVANSDYRQARTMGLADVQAPKQTASVNGKAYGSTGEADAAAADYNQPANRNARLSDAYMAKGKPMEAIQLQNATANQQLTNYKLDDAQIQHADKQANRMFMGEVQKNGGDTFQTAANLITQTNMAGMAGVKAEKRLSPDGKSVQIVATKPPGADGSPGGESILKTYSNDSNGHLQVQQDFMKIDPMTKIQWAHERAMEDRKQGNFETEQGRKVKADDQKFEYQKGNLDNQAALNDIREKGVDQRERFGLARLAASGGGRAQEDKSELRLTNAITAAEKGLLAAESAAEKKFGAPSDMDKAMTKNMAAYNAARNAAIDADPETKTRRERLNTLRARQDAQYSDEPTPAAKPLGLASAQPSASATPAGMTYIGKTPEGKPIYRTKDGKNVTKD